MIFITHILYSLKSKKYCSLIIVINSLITRPTRLSADPITSVEFSLSSMGLPGTECDNLVRDMAPFISSLLSILY